MSEVTDGTMFGRLRREQAVKSVLFTADDGDEAFRRVVYHHLVVAELSRPPRPLFDAEVEWEIDGFAVDALETVCESLIGGEDDGT